MSPIRIGGGITVASRGVALGDAIRLGMPSAPPLAPSDIPGLIAWWQASSIAQADASAVASWADSSANGHTLSQGTGANQPTLRATSTPAGGKAVDFDGTNDEMVTGVVAKVTTGGAYMAVVKLDVIDATTRLFVAHLNASTWAGAGDRFYVRVQRPSAVTIWTFGAGAVSKLDAPEETSTGWLVMIFNWSGTQMTIYRNGVALGSPVAQAATLSSSTQPICVGGTPGTSQPFNGQLAELSYFPAPGLTTQQIASLTTGRMQAHGIT